MTTLQKTQWSFSGELLYHNVNTVRCYLRENSTEDQLTVLCCNLLWEFRGTSFVRWRIFCENCLLLKLGILFILLSFLSTVCWETCYSRAEKNSVKVRDEVRNIFVKSFQSRSGLSTLLKISARCRRWTWLNRRLVWNDCRLPDQNRITGMWLS